MLTRPSTIHVEIEQREARSCQTMGSPVLNKYRHYRAAARKHFSLLRAHYGRTESAKIPERKIYYALEGSTIALPQHGGAPSDFSTLVRRAR